MDSYWNHNTAFHKFIVADAKTRGGRVLDIGCGEGLLVQRLLPIAEHVVGIDPDENAIMQSRKRLGDAKHATLIHGDFLDMPAPPRDERFQTITCVAVLHHMDLEKALAKMREFLAPGGRLIIVGLAANKSFLDYFLSVLLSVPIRIMDWFHGGVTEVNVKIAPPKESLAEIKQAASRILPGVSVKRRLYYRYVLTWDHLPN